MSPGFAERIHLLFPRLPTFFAGCLAVAAWAVTSSGATPLSVDTKFGAAAEIYALAVKSDGTILAGGEFVRYTSGLNFTYSAQHFDSDGTFKGFYYGGAHTENLALFPDGGFLAGGHFGGFDKIDRNGDPDWTFKEATPRIIPDVTLVLEDGKILIAQEEPGSSARIHWIAKILSTGHFDTNFQKQIVAHPWAQTQTRAIAVQHDGKILLGGYFHSISGLPMTNLARLYPDGTVDQSFRAALDDTIPHRAVGSLIVQPDGKILVGFQYGMGIESIYRLLPNGTLDTSFFPSQLDGVDALALQTDGKILAGGIFGLRLLDQAGRVEKDFEPLKDRRIFAVVGQVDGKILVAGVITNYSQMEGHNVMRLNSTGPATQQLDYDGQSITWLRGGTSPEVWRTQFQHSKDGTNWTVLGPGKPAIGGWQIANITLPDQGRIRARGWAAGSGKSDGIYEANLVAPWPVKLQITRQGSGALLNSIGFKSPYLIEETQSLGTPVQWQNRIGESFTNQTWITPTSDSMFFRIRRESNSQN